ncbi:xanthine dehydrogenase subunit D [Cohnella lupini]|uniref:Xanthine dehydrogenase molybdenum binding subunit apoprotein n=1 Tax=Cohnella lupini TaxID=1294267 RepID=A0A3D9IWE2_9BACL|nr:xanthine dehydrogenase subunit D [Cohnella lupini]RED65984.1 xanthine dehydrogenase molybdenum binding subunit apoprotein [Cohnella lupini]
MALTRTTSGERWRIRPDGPDKVTGKLAYLTDMYQEGMLIGRVLRSPHPHAGIVSIRTDKAKRIPGVHAVITHADVPGMNRFGIVNPDQPVLCEDRVRYIGDAIAAVAAETQEIAALALESIEVEYVLLPVVDDPAFAQTKQAPRLHPGGNVLHRNQYGHGEVGKGFAKCKHIVEESYSTPRQMHTYMETEGGLFIPEDGGRLTVYSPTQHGYKDRMQLARILGLPEFNIRVVSSPIGGSFGGKDELNVQPYGALLALVTGKPVKIHNSRYESVRAGLKRHPMKIKMRTGVDENGRIMAHQVHIVADTGAYATLGAEVLNFAIEHVTGPYTYESVEVEGVSVYTNNGVSGEFRGFGGNQAIFALEGQMDRLAEKLGMDPWEFRLANMRKPEDPGPLGQTIVRTDGAMRTWESLARSPIWLRRHDRRTSEPWIRRGTGAAIAMHGSGLGFGIPDPAGGMLALAEDGKIEAIFGYEEFGQGLIATLELMLIEQFGFGAEDVRIVIGDTDLVPHSGSSTASRATSMMWKSLQKLRGPFLDRMLNEASKLLSQPADNLRIGRGGIWDKSGEHLLLTYALLARNISEEIRFQTHFPFPVSPTKRVGAHYLYTYAAVAVEVEVNVLTGRVKVLKQFHAIAAGPVMNPQGFLGQIEGGSGMAVGFALTEDSLMERGAYLTRNLDTYLIPSYADLNGEIEVHAIEELPEDDDHGPRGVGEIGSVCIAPAISEAVFQATGKRVNKLPIDPELLQETPDFLAKAVDGI